MKTLLIFLVLCTPLLADTTWTNGGGDSSWSDAANWSNGAPIVSDTGSNVTIAVQPANNQIGIDTGIAGTGVESLTFSGSLTANVQVLAAGVEQLTLFTNITNNSAGLITFSLPVAADDQEANLLYYGTGGGLEFDGGLSVGLSPVSVSGSAPVTLGNGAYTTIAIQDGSTYGAFEGQGAVNYNDTNLQFEFTTASPPTGTSWQLFGATSGSAASVSLVGDNFDGSLDEISTGFWSGYVGGYFWTFDEAAGVLTSGTAPSLAITTQSPLGDGTNNVAYTENFAAAYGASPYQWTITSGTLPAGLALSTQGLLSGTPSGSGTFAFTVQAQDQDSNIQTKDISLIIVQPLAITAASSLPFGIAGHAYSQTLTGIGGSPGYTWSVNSGSLPGGIDLYGSGLLSGTPSASGTFNFVAKIEDASGAAVTGTFSLDIVAQLGIAGSSTLSTGTLGHTYSIALAATGGASPYGWSVIGGALPGGLDLTSGGLVTGTAGATGTFQFTAQVVDSSGQQQSQLYSLAVVNPLAVAGGALTTGTLGARYSQSLSATGGSPAYQWAFGSGSAPSGLALGSSGVLSGTPSRTGAFSFAAKATDQSNTIATGTYSIAVVSPLMITTASPITSGSVSYSYSQALGASGGQTPYTWSFAGGSLPPGLSLGTTGTLSGMPSASGTYTFDAQVSDNSGTAIGKQLTVAISPVVMPNGTVGTYVGLIDRDNTVNDGLGGRLDLTTTSAGKVTGKITQEGHAHSFKGTVISGAQPQINVTVSNGSSPSLLLAVILDGTAGQLTGTVTTNGTSAAVTGWRQVWNKKANPATALAGYYTFALSLSDTDDQGLDSIPQGYGFGTFTVGANGALRVVGKTGDGQAIATAGFTGPAGQIPVYQSLYSNGGSLIGWLTLTTGTASAENVVTGSLTWSKPDNSSRAYAPGFPVIPLSANGAYMAASSGKHIVLGLPDSSNSASLLFDDGGVADASINPDIDAFTFTTANKVVLPQINPGKVTLAISPVTGAVSGGFTLVDGKLTRHVTYQGIIVRSLAGGVEAPGYFLLPQIPTGGQTINTSPILSGQVYIQQ